MKLFDVVATVGDLPDAHLDKGQVGAIVEDLGNNTFLVEFADLDGVAYTISPVPGSLLMELKHAPAQAT